MADVIAELVGRLGFEVDDRGLQEFDRGMGDADRSAKGLSKTASAAATAIGNLAAEAIKAGVALLKDLVVSTAEAGDEIAKTAKQLGVGTTELQRMRFAAERSGASSEQLDKAVKKLNVGLVDAQIKGTGPLAEAIEILGLNLDDLANLDTEQRLGVLAEALKGVEDQTVASAVTAKLFGERAGPLIKPLLDEGAAGIKALGDRAEELGGVLDDKTLKASEDMQDALLDLKTATFGAGAQIVSGLLPAVTDAAGGIADWVAENQEFVQQDLPDALTKIAEATATVVEFFVDAIASVDDFITEVERLVDDVNDEYGPAIDMAIKTGQTLVDVWTDIAGGIAKGAAHLLEFVGVLEDAEATIYRVKVGLGMDDTPLADKRGDVGFLGGESNENNVRRRVEQSNRAAAEAGQALARANNDAVGGRLNSILAGFDKQAAARGRGLGLGDLGKNGKGKGSKGKGKGLDTTEAELMFGDRIRELGAFAGATDKAIQAAIDSIAQSLDAGASGGVAFEAGVGQLEGLTGADLSGALGSALEGALLGIQGSAAGGGANPTAGAKFVRIDASFNAPTEVNLHLPQGQIAGLSPRETLQMVEDVIGEALAERNRQAYDHYKRSVRT